VLESPNVGLKGPSQWSVAVGVSNTGCCGQSIVVGSSVDVKKGALVSTTVMTSVVVAVFPHASVAVYVRVTL
jgi:hypothetical protein